jgi:hypothetical protein
VSDTDDPERQLRIDQMTINIEKMRFDMAETQREAAALAKWESRKFLVQTLAAAAGLLAAGGLIGGVAVSWLNAHQPPREPAVVQYVLPPGSTVTVPK